MGWVGFAAEGVQNEDIEALEQWNGLWRDVGHVGEVGGGAKTVAGDGVAAVGNRDSLKCSAKEVDAGAEIGGKAVDFDAGAGGVAVDGAEGVLEDALDDLCGGVVGVEGDAFGGAETKRAEVVHAEDVVGVGVGVEDGVDGHDALADSLGVEVGAGVDEDGVVVIRERDGWASAAVGVSRDVGSSADRARAAERGNAH